MDAQINEKNDYCKGCVLSEAAMIKAHSLEPVDLLMVSNYPFVNGYEPKTFVGEFGEKANRMAKNVLVAAFGKDKSRFRVGYTYALRCITDTVGFKPDTAVYNRCSYYLKNYIDHCKPKVIITLGLQAFKGLEFKLAKLHDVRGRVYKFGNAVVIPTFHPMEIIKTPGKMELFKKDIALAVSIINQDTEQNKVMVETPMVEEEIIARLGELKAYVSEHKLVVAVDTETTGIHPYAPGSRLIMLSLSWANNEGIAFPFDHRDFKYSDNFYTAVRDFFDNPGLQTVYHNAKFDVKWLKKYGINVDNICWDTLLAEHLVDEDKKGNYGLKDLTCLYYPSMGKYEDELQHILSEVKKTALDEFKQACTDGIAVIASNWVANPNMEKAADWVNKKYIKMDDAKLLTGFPVSKKTGKITKGTLTKIISVLKRIPEFEKPKIRKVTFEDIEVNALAKYAAIDAIMTRKLVQPQSEACIADRKKTKALNIKPLTWAMRNISLPLTLVLADMEYQGIKVDRERIAEFKTLLKGKIAECEEQLYMEVGRKFNYKAAELNDILFKELNLPVLNTTKTGKESTDADTLAELFKQTGNKVVQALLLVRKFEKVHKTYLTAWEVMSEEDGRLHTQFNQTNVATHRLSSSNPEHRLGL